MFTGIVTAIGTVANVETMGEDKRFTIQSPYEATTIDLGASIAHDGCCLTVTTLEKTVDGARYTIDASTETLRLTTLGAWKPGTRINLERSLKLGDEMGGHLVTGHVDGMASVTKREDGENTSLFEIEAPENLAKFIAKKGSVCLQGTSLTVNKVEGDRFTLMLIPHTLEVTTWGDRQVGDAMNIEIDLMARYAERLMQADD
ncbi:MAG: riboflavin synthase [Rhizobiales bacterium]|nr:riboflavin synthase [Hyphomicrobiales bacterium]MBO6698288.1 riboflavin synthase [Hyphomicrobiales bacterium]MBO6735458.1 riboflavin synthase [Hyphomicrobiales bacterium]MBO6910734.1 riboflavin synthase [Hyphomicrobiales bacterium]MBO6956743.1 riboflavin synthase [Hyphomicrobiales bacterium]